MACYIYICGGGGSFILVVRPWRGVVMGVASTQRSGLGSNTVKYKYFEELKYKHFLRCSISITNTNTFELHHNYSR